MIRWTIYSRPDCSLCDSMVSELTRLAGAPGGASLQIIDVDSDPQLQRKYGLRIPVLLADGEFVCAYRLDEDRVKAVLRGAGA